jgi:hypothetical protein
MRCDRVNQKRKVSRFTRSFTAGLTNITVFQENDFYWSYYASLNVGNKIYDCTFL